MEKIGSTETHTYDAANQITGTGFTYDACGNLTSGGEWAYEYDRGSRLASATNASANLKVVFAYDPQGRRISKTACERDAQGNYTQQKYARFYHYDAGGNILAETGAAGNVIRSFAYDLAGHPVAFTQDLGQGIKTFYVHTNARGDVACITDDTMAWVKKYAYDPWGRITSETARSSAYDNLKCPYGYAGYFHDAETGLYCMPARYYSPAQRRFLTRDPHPGSKSQPITLNSYQYCKNNPINKVDPTGQFDWDAAFSGLQGLGDCGVGQIAAGAALANEGIRQVIGGLRQFNAGINMARAGMRSMMGGLGMALGGMNSAVAGVSALAGFNFGSMAAVGIRGGTTKKASLEHTFSIFPLGANGIPMKKVALDPRSGVEKFVWKATNNVLVQGVYGLVTTVSGVSALAHGDGGVTISDGVYTTGEAFSYAINGKFFYDSPYMEGYKWVPQTPEEFYGLDVITGR